MSRKFQVGDLVRVIGRPDQMIVVCGRKGLHFLMHTIIPIGGFKPGEVWPSWLIEPYRDNGWWGDAA
jgi:hypothetical protein